MIISTRWRTSSPAGAGAASASPLTFSGSGDPEEVEQAHALAIVEQLAQPLDEIEGVAKRAARAEVQAQKSALDERGARQPLGRAEHGEAQGARAGLGQPTG